MSIDIDDDREIPRFELIFRIFGMVPVLFLYSTVASTLTLSTILMIVFQQKYPKWWFRFKYHQKEYSMRVYAYCTYLVDQCPSTTDKQNVHVEIDFPGQDVSEKLSRWAPLYKIILGIPHMLCLFALFVAALVSVVFAWFAILFTKRYPKCLSNFVIGFLRWELRFEAYAILMVTDEYPPFSMQ